mmetsp:Transcript_16997/g.38954  ORF Transcript_16997/g.38954 Transcript_16997/m.38954 type:complete len:288 (+) Transcript_16997:154-1017(+)
MNLLVNLLTMNFPYATETVCVMMAIQGSMGVRNTVNQKRQMHWFHSFLRSTLTAFAGASFTNIFMGRPTAMFSNDIFFGSCILGYGIVNWLPMDLGFHFFNTFPGALIYTVFSQIFRVGGVQGFSDAAYGAFKDAPSVYYPTPVFGPILFPTALGNMGGFFWRGFDAYLGEGMPWLFQQGLFCSTFYHFYAHDKEGFIGVALRQYLKPFAVTVMAVLDADETEMLDDALFAKFAVGVFMVTMGILQMPQLLGPRFSPFTAVGGMAGKLTGGKKKKALKPKKSKKKTQ